MPKLTEAGIRALMVKTFGERLGPADKTFGSLEQMLAPKLADVTEPLLEAVFEAATEVVKGEMKTLLSEIYLTLDIYDDLTLKIMSDQNGESIDFHHPIITLYDLILRDCSSEIERPTGIEHPSKYQLDAFIHALETLITRLKNTKSWTGTSFDSPDDEPVPLTMNERDAGTVTVMIDDGRIEKPEKWPYYAVYVDTEETIYKSRAHATAAFHAMMKVENVAAVIQLKCMDHRDYSWSARGIPEVVLATKPAGIMEVTLHPSYYLRQPNYESSGTIWHD